jgi:YidC/Oxa1 family membrane protein insertase
LARQQGLPDDLTISSQPPVADQSKTLYDMAIWLQQNGPKGGPFDKILGSLKGMFGGGAAVAPTNISRLANLTQAEAELIRGKMLAVQGVFTPGQAAGTGSMTSEGTTCLLSLSPGLARAGLPDSVDGLPVRAEGVAEVLANGVVSLRVQKLQPAESLTFLRLGRVYEIQKDYADAVWAYKLAAAAAKPEDYLPGAFGATEAGFLTHNQLQQPSASQPIFASAWTNFTIRDAGKPRYTTWVQNSSGSWDAEPVSTAIAPTLKALNSGGTAYKIVDFFVTLMGGNAALGFLLLAVVTRMLVYPLTKKQLSSARDMQRLQPLMKKLQDKHKNDKQKFQEEFWKLCQEHGVNPLGGCLPMVVQMPLLFFVYAGIRGYIVNLDTQGFLWAHSLAQPDMWLLIAYTVSQVFFGKLTQAQNPQAAIDPQQKQQQQMMTYMMPVMFFFLFQSFPAGFMLYWLGTNVAYIGQQFWFNYTAGPLLPPDENPQKPAGSGGGGWFGKMMAGATPPPEKPPAGDLESFQDKQAKAAGKMTSREEAEKSRKKRRGSRP